MTKYRQKLTVTEAFQITKETRRNDSIWPDWLKKARREEPSQGALWRDKTDKLLCGGSEGICEIMDGDWLVQGLKGEVYLYKSDIFSMLYEPVVEEDKYEEAERNMMRKWLRHQNILPDTEGNTLADTLRLVVQVQALGGNARHIMLKGRADAERFDYNPK